MLTSAASGGSERKLLCLSKLKKKKKEKIILVKVLKSFALLTWLKSMALQKRHADLCLQQAQGRELCHVIKVSESYESGSRVPSFLAGACWAD